MAVSEPILPEYIFKYTSLEKALRIIKENRLWFSNPRSFNDPFDCCIDLIDFTPRKEDIDTFIKEKVQAGRTVRRAEIRKNMKNPYRIVSQTSDQSNELFERSGVCCFSEINDNILMWSHYANNHRGICIKFSSSIAKIGTMTDRVIYSNQYAKSNFWINKGDSIHHLIFTKAKDWQYEKEIRIFAFLETGNISFDATFIQEIIFGCKVSQDEIKNFRREIVNLDYKSIKLSQAKQIKNSFDLQFGKLDV